MENETKRTFVCPHCHAKQEWPESTTGRIRCETCGMAVELRESSGPLPRAAATSEDELFPDQRPIDLSATPLLEDPLARGRFSRKRKGAGFIERIKPPDEGQRTKFERKRKKRMLALDKALTETEWDEDGADRISPDSKKSASNVLPWIALAALVIVAVLIAVVSHNGAGDHKPGAQNSLATPGPDANTAPIDYAEALRTIKQFIDAKSVEELIGFIRDPDRVVPLAREYYERFPYQQESYVAPADLAGLPVDGNYIEVNLDGSISEKRPIVLERIGNQFKVDWECWVAHSDTSWDDFLSQRMTEPQLFRVYLGLDDYYNHKFTDSFEYRSYQIQDQLGNHQIYGYVERDGVVEQRLQYAFKKVRYGCVMVKLRFPEDNPDDVLGNQVIITEFVQFGWVVRSD